MTGKTTIPTDAHMSGLQSGEVLRRWCEHGNHLNQAQAAISAARFWTLGVLSTAASIGLMLLISPSVPM
jgi:hypothetical protein